MCVPKNMCVVLFVISLLSFCFLLFPKTYIFPLPPGRLVPSNELATLAIVDAAEQPQLGAKLGHVWAGQDKRNKLFETEKNRAKEKKKIAHK